MNTPECRYQFRREGLRWVVRAGTGTRPLFRVWRERTARKLCTELLCAFMDGDFARRQRYRDELLAAAEARRRIWILAKALLFYAKGRHYGGFLEAEFEAPDEPNWMCPTTEAPSEEQWNSLLLEDGGVAAAGLRAAFGRKTTMYECHTSRGHPAAEVCSHRRIATQCWRCHPERVTP